MKEKNEKGHRVKIVNKNGLMEQLDYNTSTKEQYVNLKAES